VLPGAAEVDGHPGLGVRGVVTELCTGPRDDARVVSHAALVGRPELLARHGIALPPELAGAVAVTRAGGGTAVAVSWDGVARAVLAVTDPVRPSAAAAVRRLRALGLRPVMLTGADAGTARGLAAAVGIDPADVRADVARADRGAVVAGLRARGATVAVVGGVADAAALAAGDVALVRATPASPARATGDPPERSAGPGDVVLDDADPLTAVDGLRLARRTVRTVERVVVATATYHLLALPLAATGLLPPLAAAGGAALWPAAVLAHAAGLRRLRPTPRAIDGPRATCA
jgi:Cu+-exporting ATPase